VLLEVTLEESQTIDNPDDPAIAAAITNLPSEWPHCIRLRDGTLYISTFREENGFVVTYKDQSGRIYSTDSPPLSRDTVIRIFEAYNRKDTSWRDQTLWKDVTDELRKVTPLALFTAYVLMITGAAQILFGYLLRGILGKMVFIVLTVMGLLFASAGVALWLLWKSAGRRDRNG
jgi:hypothetical protein